MKDRHTREIKTILLLASGIILLASVISYNPSDLAFFTSSPNMPAKNFVRVFGAYLSAALFFLIGWAAYVLPFLVFYWAARVFKGKAPNLRAVKVLGAAVLFMSLSSLLAMCGIREGNAIFARGGLLGFASSAFMVRYFGNFGAATVFLALGTLSFILATDYLASHILSGFSTLYASLLSILNYGNRVIRVSPRFKKINASRPPEEARAEEAAKPRPAAAREELPLKPRIEIKVKEQKQPAKIKIPEMKIGDYKLPSLALLDSPPPIGERQLRGDLTSNARILEETLSDFGISVKVTDIERGPVITRYELEPAPGVKVQKITSLGDDIALALKAQSVRIVAPIPGKARVGIEVPNAQSSLVYLQEVLSSKEYLASDSKLTLVLGKDIAGKSVIADLGEMPHLLIAGTTGSGKTVCVNSLIMSILFKSTPREVKLLMVDPKMVELAPYNGLPHLLCPVVTNAKKASNALNWVVAEMEERYKLLAGLGVRNIASYNEKSESLMPYIVVIIDELADLMVVAQEQIEDAITRLAQLSRAVGIHLLLATQRPSVDVITGVIKANFPARISFQVASKVDSRTVLDANGADKLLGRGDMLFLSPGESKLIRAQGSLIKDKEIERVVDFIKSQSQPVYEEAILKEQERSSVSGGIKDELYDEAVRLIMQSGHASVSILQRRMRLGYTRAARLIDMMEESGLLGPYQGSKPREILINREEWLRENLNKEGASKDEDQIGAAEEN
ncbi:MAG: DNA translocase FtsK [Candidatus Omnitrophica bacterium]|nr:DNA translocase FtsK [Candidatus Omnitrophota bacterium]